MNIVVAMDNFKIKDELSNIYKNNVYIHDINYMEGVIEYLTKTKSITKRILITKDSLQGNLIKETYIKQIKLADSNTKIVLFVQNLTENYKEFLFANEVFNIIEGDIINIDQIKKCIDGDTKVVYKLIDNNENISKNEYIMNIKNQIISKQFISVFGTSGAGKSYVSSIISKKLSEDLKIKIGLLDMDFQNPAIDIINNLDFSNNSLSEFIDSIDRGVEIGTNIKDMMKKSSLSKNIYYMTNNSNIYEYQNKLNISYYEKIYDCCRNNYDYIIVDLPSSPFIDVVKYTLNISSKIFFVVNPNYISIRQASKYLELINKLWSISKDKIYIIINKAQNGSLDKLQVQSLLGRYNILTDIYFDYNIEECINGMRNSMNCKVNLKRLYEDLDIKIEDNIKSKNIIFSKIINKVSKVGVQ